MKTPTKVRLDKLLVDRGLVPSRERAQALILAGRVLVEEQKVEKAGASVPEHVAIRLLGDDLRYVSRGGLKLEGALRQWGIDLGGRVGLDIGTSTGGFVDCMLQHGAARVIAVDTGYGQIDAKLRNEPRLTLHERTNARFMTAELLGEAATQVSFVTMDVSFISATLVLPAVIASVQSLRCEYVVLVKPQFEVGREKIGKGGIVRSEAAQQAALDRVRECVAGLGAREMEAIDSPILGAEGNREFLLHFVIEK